MLVEHHLKEVLHTIRGVIGHELVANVTHQHMEFAFHLQVVTHERLIDLLVIVSRVTHLVVVLRFGKIGAAIIRFIFLCQVQVVEGTVGLSEQVHHVGHSNVILGTAWSCGEQGAHLVECAQRVVHRLIGHHLACREHHRAPFLHLQGVIDGDTLSIVARANVAVGKTQLDFGVIGIFLRQYLHDTQTLLSLTYRHVSVAIDHEFVSVIRMSINVLSHKRECLSHLRLLGIMHHEHTIAQIEGNCGVFRVKRVSVARQVVESG